jgi:glycerol-3-phosphate dehydrogenase
MPGASASAYLARAALRPLVASLRSRDFSAGFTERGVLVVAGGKLTSHRAMAEAAVDQLLARTPVPDGSAPRSRTTETLLPGAPPLPLELWLRDGPGAGLVPEPVRRHLLLRYGARAPGVFARIERDPSSARPLHPERPEILAEVDFAVEEELATTLSDVMWRRLGLAFSRDGGAAAVDAVDRRLAERLGLSTAERRASRERFEQERAAALLAPADLVEAAG